MSDLSAVDAISLIKVAQKYGVSKLKFGTLEIELDQVDLDENTRASRPALKVSKKEIVEQEKSAQLQMDFDLAKEQLATMHVEDPVGFEQAIIENELTSDGGEKFEEAQHIGAEATL